MTIHPNRDGRAAIIPHQMIHTVRRIPYECAREGFVYPCSGEHKQREIVYRPSGFPRIGRKLQRKQDLRHRRSNLFQKNIEHGFIIRKANPPA